MPDLIQQIRDFILADRELSQKMQRVKLIDGQILFKKGDFSKAEALRDRNSAFYLIKSGQIGIYKCDRDQAPLNVLGTGETIGELALVDGQPHAVTAVSIGRSDLLCLSRDDFLRRVYNSAELSQLLIKLGNQRLHCLIDYIKSLESWMHLVADSKCVAEPCHEAYRVVEELEDFTVQENGVVKSGYLAGMLATVADSFKDIVHTVQQLKGSECELKIELNLEIDEDQHQQQVEEIISADYFTYLLEVAERRNKTVRDHS